MADILEGCLRMLVQNSVTIFFFNFDDKLSCRKDFISFIDDEFCF